MMDMDNQWTHEDLWHDLMTGREPLDGDEITQEDVECLLLGWAFDDPSNAEILLAARSVIRAPVRIDYFLPFMERVREMGVPVTMESVAEVASFGYAPGRRELVRQFRVMRDTQLSQGLLESARKPLTDWVYALCDWYDEHVTGGQRPGMAH